MATVRSQRGGSSCYFLVEVEASNSHCVFYLVDQNALQSVMSTIDGSEQETRVVDDLDLRPQHVTHLWPQLAKQATATLLIDEQTDSRATPALSVCLCSSISKVQRLPRLPGSFVFCCQPS